MESTVKQLLKAAFPYTIPILAGYAFLGFALGVLMSAAGFHPLITILMSVIVYAGSGQFAAVNLLTAAFNPIGAFLLELMVNARHVFYGLSLLDKYKRLGRKRWYMVFGLTDETFSVNVGVESPQSVNSGWFMFAITVLNHVYWVCATGLGAIFGRFVHFNTKGLDFVMTALFIVIFLEQWLKEKSHYSALIGLVLSFGSLLLFGSVNFLVPAMLAIFLILTLLRKPLEAALRCGEQEVADE
ncbi:MAG: AzlC family ABC transporter permease [Oscillospiraceae bacterium]|nr:AzlC family ABC transporter permease [Oscillospiraceae bacterium]